MKKNLFLALALLLSVSLFAQNNSFIINESFDSAEMPEGWYFIGEGADNFKINATNNAGGDPNELYFKSSPIVTAGIHLVMGSADLTGVDALGLSFKHNLNNAQLSSTIGIATSSDNGTTWNTGWSKTYTDASSSGQYNINETIKTSDMGKDNVLICLFYEGNTYNFNKWYFDDISIFPKANGNDIQLSSINVNNVTAAGDTKIDFTVNNIGSTEITSFEANYTIEGYGTVSEIFSEKIAPSDNKTLTFKKEVYLMPGTHTIKINILNVNSENDINLDNNTLSKDVRAYMKEVERTPLVEHFSSSTCVNCVTADNTLLTLTHDNEGRYTYVKYPWDYPRPGDPYYIEDCKVRGQYYGVNGVPDIIFDGNTKTKEPKQSHFDNRFAIPSYIDIAGAFNIEEKTVKVTADIVSYIDMSDIRVFFTVNEKTTTGNALPKDEGGNGVEEFHHVLMSMLTGTEGIDTSFSVGQYQRYEFSCDMSDTKVEEMEDLEVAVWVQKYDSKEVFNSSFLYEYTDHPYPVQNLKLEDKTLSWEAPEKGSPIGYNVFVNNKLTAEKITETSHTIKDANENVVIEVFALYENETSSVGVSLFVETENETGIPSIEKTQSINIYPNPANDRLYIEAEVEIEDVVIYDVYGRRLQSIVNSQQSLSVDLSDLKSGIYFIKINTNKGNIVKRIIKN